MIKGISERTCDWIFIFQILISDTADDVKINAFIKSISYFNSRIVLLATI